MAAKAQNHEWQTIDGVFSLVVTGKNERGDEQTIAIPAAALPTLAGEARRRSMASDISAQRQVAGVWSSVLLLPVQTWNAGTTDSGTVALILDRGLDTEIQYHMPIEHARGVAGLLLEEADKASSIAPVKN